MITEQVEGWGSWTIRLDGLPDDKTPAHVWKALDPETSAFGHILVTPNRVDPLAVGDAGMLAVSKYTGMYRGTGSRNEISGVGLVAWLGDEDEKGDIAETAVTGGTGSFSDWVNAVLPDAITAGTINAVAGTLTESMLYMSPRQMLSRIMDYFGAVYRVNPDGTLDAGEEDDLFATTPNHILIWRGSGPDAALHGLKPGTIDLSRDLEDYTTKIVMLAEGDGQAIAVGTATAGSVPYKDLHGNTVVRKRLVNAPDVSAGNANTLATAQLGRFNKVRKAYRLSTADWGVAVVNRGGKRLEPGDHIWVYDPRPDAKLVDTANQVVYQGEVLQPIKLRLEAITWPVQEGMGVYFRYHDGSAFAYVDLSNHVVYDTGETTLDVGAAQRRLTSDPSPGQIQARVQSLAPLGQIGYSESTGNQGSITTEVDLSGLSVSVTVGSGRRIRVSFFAEFLIGVSGQVTCIIYEDSTGIQRATTAQLNASNVVAVSGSRVYTPDAGSYTFKVTAQTASGASGSANKVAAATRPAFILVEDLGAA